MSLKLEILRFPDFRLRNKAVKVETVTKELAELAGTMLEIMYQEQGVGLSSIQVNQPPRLFVADTQLKSNDRYKQDDMGELEQKITQPLVFFNPEILSRQGEIIFKEGCLSFPSYYADVKRSQVIEVRALDQKGKVFTLKVDGLLAVCIQHEIDHLDGKLFIDHLSPLKAQQLRDKIKKHGYPERFEIKTS